MGDLDDFFAKKDKKRTKGGKTKKELLEQPEVKSTNSSNVTNKESNTKTKPQHIPKENSEVAPDLSKLKINSNVNDGSENVENVNVWSKRAKKKKELTEITKDEKVKDKVAEEKPKPKQEEPAVVAPPENKKSSYLPPHLRNGPPELPKSKVRPRRGKGAPDLENEMSFPTLG